MMAVDQPLLTRTALALAGGLAQLAGDENLAPYLWAARVRPVRAPGPEERPVVAALVTRLEQALANARGVEAALAGALVLVVASPRLVGRTAGAAA